MNNPIKISVVIPVYNVEKYIEECLESVILQQLNEIEIICINDSSTDKSEEIVEKYRKKDKRIVLMRNKRNCGLSYTRNIGMSVAKGKYIYFLDSDDMITENALINLYETAEKNQLDGIFFDASLLICTSMLEDEVSNQTYQRNGINQEVQSGKKLLHQFLKNNNFLSSVPQQFWNKTFLDKNNISFFNGILHEDELFSFRAISLASRVCYMNKNFYIRRVRDASIMTSKRSYKNLIGVWTCFYYMTFIAAENDYEDKKLVDSHVARMYNLAVDLYEKYGESINLDDFSNEQLAKSFQIFMATQQRYMAYGLFSAAQIDFIRMFSKIYVYGAGSIAKSVIEGLIRHNLVIEGVVVTKIGHNEKAFMGHRLYEFKELKENREGVLFVVATSLLFQKKIIDLLKMNRMQYMCWEDNE